LINLEINLTAGKGLSLGALGRLFSGKIAEYVGTISLKLLSYSLLAVFLYGGSSIVQKLYNSGIQSQFELTNIITCTAFATVIALLLPIKLIDYINRVLFIALLLIVIVLIIGLTTKIDWSDLPLSSKEYSNISTWQALIP